MVMLGERPFQIQVSTIDFNLHFRFGQISERQTTNPSLKKNLTLDFKKTIFLHYLRSE